ncbi:MAG: 50S ribosomal protein L3 [Methanocalculus sp. MSAO_Arc1]|uniref:50S ribosomal protein L3 n=1 Tax=Methanocalculus TaxID=71151 RepID=UPI000FF3C72A|nr:MULTISPECIES: 50S ribosomal protein L3 [unclassified Methanocalculus]MCP1662978.1 large subunit ribosomal protein L3 [Methanocalculus sp. AMF5]RQD80747.1 MAG: 50S ribosomal protein L3 [Methanocalculus sp. MSAO_Arc1]
MPRIHRPRYGSLAFSPRKRARSEVPKYKSWPKYNGTPVLQGFAGYKVGMTHVIMIDDHKSSPSEGKDIMIPVTVVEVPAMKVAAIRAYRKDTYGKHPMTEIWAEKLEDGLSERITVPKNHDRTRAAQVISDAVAADSVEEIMLLMHTTPEIISGIPKKIPDLMEIRVAGGTVAERLEYAQSLLGQDVDFASVLAEGAYADITAITTGKGTQGAVKRWGISIRKRKHSRGGKKRHIGTLGPWTPHHVRWQVPNVGQMGYQQRTEYNKRIIKIGSETDEINPEGGFLHYGLVRNNYVLIKGSIPGPSKRIIRFRPAIRQGEHKVRVPAVEYVSLESKQG